MYILHRTSEHLSKRAAATGRNPYPWVSRDDLANHCIVADQHHREGK